MGSVPDDSSFDDSDEYPLCVVLLPDTQQMHARRGTEQRDSGVATCSFWTGTRLRIEGAPFRFASSIEATT
jgi:hypothetical protein